jgi:hypothetical protein
MWHAWGMGEVFTFSFHKDSRLLYGKLSDCQLSKNIVHHGVSK